MIPVSSSSQDYVRDIDRRLDVELARQSMLFRQIAGLEVELAAISSDLSHARASLGHVHAEIDRLAALSVSLGSERVG